MNSSEPSMSSQNDSQPLPKPAGWRSPVWFLLMLLLLGGGGFAWWRGLPSEAPSTATAQQPPMPVQAITLQTKPIEERSEFVATLQSRRSVTLRPRTQGQITRILVTPGQRIEAGIALIQIDPSEQQAVVNSAQASVASAQANVDNANAVLRSLQAERLSTVAEMQLSQVESDRYARTILMPAIAALLGAYPMLFPTGAGPASRQSLGTTVFGGTLVATFLSLFVVPVLYIVIGTIHE